MEYFLQQLINGLTLGAIYGLIAIGYTMVYGIIGMVNFAHGDVYMIGAFQAMIVLLITSALGISWVPLQLALMLLVAIVLTAAYGWTVERIAYRPLRGSTRLAPLISAIGMSIVLQNYVQLLQGPRPKPVEPLIRGGFALTSQESGFVVQLGYLQVVIVILTVVLMAGFAYLIAKTPLGRAQRACEQDRKMASLHHGCGARGGCRHDGNFVLGRERFLHGLHRRHQGLHGRRPGRDRVIAWRHVGWCPDRLDRSVLVGLFLSRI